MFPIPRVWQTYRTQNPVLARGFGFKSHGRYRELIVEFRNDEIRKLRDSISSTHRFRPSGHRFLISVVTVMSAASRALCVRLFGILLQAGGFSQGTAVPAAIISLRIQPDRGDMTAVERFIAGIQTWDADLRQQTYDGKLTW